jgi:hypothetical protein
VPSSAITRRLHAVDPAHLLAQVQRDAVLGIPGVIVENDVLDRHLAGEHRREQDAVVVGVRLGAENGDLVLIGGDLQQLLERAHAGHAVADHHQFLLAHGTPDGNRKLSLETCPLGIKLPYGTRRRRRAPAAVRARSGRTDCTEQHRCRARAKTGVWRFLSARRRPERCSRARVVYLSARQ